MRTHLGLELAAAAWLAFAAPFMSAQEPAPTPAPAPSADERLETWPSGTVKLRVPLDEQGREHGLMETFAENGTNLETVRPYFPADPAPDLGGIGLTSRHFVVQGRLRQGDRVLEERSLVQRRQLEVVVLQREQVNLRDGS